MRIIIGDARERLAGLPSESVHCVVTSPPYWGLRDYGIAGQIGREDDFRDYIDTMVAVFADVRRVLRSDGTAWVNIGDCYANDGKWGGATGGKHAEFLHGQASRIGREKRRTGLKPKDLVGMPWEIAFALRADGWWLRSDIIWHKPNPMPESITDRPTSAHEHVFLLAKSDRYFFDDAAVKETVSGTAHARGNGVHPKSAAPGSGIKQNSSFSAAVRELVDERNIRNVWTVATQPYSEAHFATFPPALIEPCIKAGCPVGGTVLDPFGGAGTTGLVADRMGRHAILIELNPQYAEMARRRIESDAGMFAEVAGA